MIIKAKWSNAPLKLFMDTKWEETSDIGHCCVVFAHWPYFEFSQNQETDKKTILNGLQNGLMLTLDLEKFNFGQITDSSGFKVGLSHPQDRIVLRNVGINIPSGFLTEVAVVPTTVETTNEAIQKFQPEERNCYTEEEFDLRYHSKKAYESLLPWPGFRYSMDNCLYDAFIQRVIDECNCSYAGFNFTRLVRPDLHACGIENPDEYRCANELGKKIGSNGMNYAINAKNGKSMKCRSRCHDQHSNVLPTMLSYPNDNFDVFKHYCETCLIMEKLTMICNDQYKKDIFEKHYAEEIKCKELLDFHSKNNATCDGFSYFDPNVTEAKDTKVMKFYLKYSKENFAKLAIYFRDPYHTKIVWDDKITFTTFICNAGGLVGLCLGLSFISLFELLYHIFKFIFDF